MTGVRATVVDEIRSEAGKAPGAIEYRRRQNGAVAGIAFRCPCGCGYESYLPIQSDGREGWTFNGSEVAPTTSPSILQSGLPCKWHGYLTDGVFREC